MRYIFVFLCALAFSIPAFSKAQVMCTMEAKQCPDGSYVSRQGPKCEFAPCPNATKKKPSQPPLYVPLSLERIVDGDTIVASGKTIRLWGIDTPEKDEPLYEEAGLALKLFIEGSNLRCKFIDIDRYKRSVMHCLVDEADLGSLMVQSGWARDYKQYSGSFYNREENFAKAASLGIWK